MNNILYIFSILFFILTAYKEIIKQLHMAQLEGYRPNQYFTFLKHNFKSNYIKGNEGFIISFIILIILNFISKNNYLLQCVYVAACLFVLYKNENKKVKAKKPLVYTSRAKRLLSCNVIVIGLLLYVIFRFSSFGIFILSLILIRIILSIIMLLSTIIMYPIEMLIQYRYFREAQIKIRRMKNLKVIGITGSYGKTSTKYFIKTILSEKYNTLMTPESFNTPMGITKVIREQLNEEHEVFVCEMGARYMGDIKTLCRLANPSIGVLTSVGRQHLETFKSIENVAKTKYELIESLPESGVAVFNGDNEYCLKLSEKTKVKTYLYGIKNADKNVFVYAKDIETTKEGLRFRVCGNNGINFSCKTSLLGKHNISNILAAICVAFELGLNEKEIISGVSKIKPVPHRLQLVDTNNGVTVIDDAFNSNPVGASEALETLKEIPGNKKIIVTPGMVELGEIEYEENKKLGEKIAQCCDYAILVGIKRSRPIKEGLLQKGFNEDKIFVVSNLDEATARLSSIVSLGDVVLFENDLPDNYNE
ncbi:UDP-N-acetylmuramoyl-tripeptide--D-alanyl-D-alanine ligase [Caloramator quimbayensis]|uniref:UDP-N-acetylmuramoyl-tripeptide--D-alanyl-D-alanine ligase n=1 Tax=Caloramator quimbayensis TaxID=1147123 RepID=A0A1T4X7I4_9CLOT|nr:UDP-N-acetylmuramoyl-tripeptide--D-alanyl-D-alanine ligase [Caloramator quimbayensis]SKA85078.1 UDP-N-acetylmuramoyl-tripeptide--D-alanyl-D-alanine ligase [Caloramator quimbayensis]